MGEIAAMQQPFKVAQEVEVMDAVFIGIVKNLSDKDRYLLLSIALLLADPIQRKME